YFVRRNFARDGPYELRIRAETPAQADIVGFDLCAVVQAGQAALKADVSDVVLAAGVRAAVEVNADRLRPTPLAFPVAGHLPQAVLCLRDGEVAELVAGAGDRAFMKLRDLPLEPDVAQGRLHVRQIGLGNVREKEVLLVGRPQAAVAPARGDIRGGEHLLRC